MDWKIFEHCADLFKQQNDIGIKTNAKARLRLLDAIEKGRKVLSANLETGINVDCVAEDYDLNVSLTREKFEELVTPIFERFRVVLQKLKSEIKVNVQSVELIGGGTRIPAIQKIINEVFELEVSRTLNSTENCARGCGIQAAMLSPLFKVAEYKIEEANYYPIRCSWLFQDSVEAMNVEGDQKNNPEKQTSILFDKGCSIPSVKAITFHRDDPLINFKLTYDPLPEGASPLVGNFLIHSIKPKETEFGVKVRVLLNKNGMVEFESANLNEDYYEIVEDKKDEKKDEKKEGEKKEGDTQIPEEKAPEEIKKKKKTRSTPLKADINFLYHLPPNIINTFIQDEIQMNNQDRITLETYEKKNELETYIYKMRNEVNDKLGKYVHPNVKATFLAELEKAEGWLYGDGSKTSKDVYNKKIEELKFFGNPIEKRYFEYNNLPETAEKFLTILKSYENVVTSNVRNALFVKSQGRCLQPHKL
jgi:heat shock 70kDa protein 4